MAAAAAVTLFRQGAASHADEPVPLPTAPSAGRIPARVAVPAHLSDLARFARVLRSEPGFDTADEVAWARRQCAGWSGAPGGLAVLLEMLMARATFPGPDPGDPPTAAGYRFPRPVPIALGSATARSREVCHVDLPGWDVVRVGQGGDVRLLVAWVVGLRVRWLKGEARLDCLCQLRTGEVSFFHDDAIQRIFPRAYYEHPPSLQAHALITKPSFGSLACLMVWAVGCFNVVADPGFRTIVIKSNHMVHRTMSSRSQTITVTGTNELKFLHGVRVGAALGTHASFDLRGVPLAARGLAPLAPVAVLPAPRFKQKAPVPFLRPLLGDAYRCVRCPVGPERSRLEARIRARCASADEATARAVEEVLARGLPCEAGRRAEHVLVLDAAEGPPGEGVGARTRRGRKRGREDVVVDEEAREEEAIAAWRGAFLRRVEESDSEHLKSLVGIEGGTGGTGGIEGGTGGTGGTGASDEGTILLRDGHGGQEGGIDEPFDDKIVYPGYREEEEESLLKYAEQDASEIEKDSKREAAGHEEAEVEVAEDIYDFSIFGLNLADPLPEQC